MGRDVGLGDIQIVDVCGLIFVWEGQNTVLVISAPCAESLDCLESLSEVLKCSSLWHSLHFMTALPFLV